MIRIFQQGLLVIPLDLKVIFKKIIVHNPAYISEWLHVYLNEQLIYSDGLACHLVYQALEKEDYLKSMEAGSNVNGPKFATGNKRRHPKNGGANVKSC